MHILSSAKRLLLKSLLKTSLGYGLLACLLFNCTPLGADPLALPPQPEMHPSLGSLEHFFKESEGKWVSLDKTRFVPYDTQSLKDISFLLIYYSASWCPPCKIFTPELLAFYNKMKETYGDCFELVLFSLDRKEIDLLNYMKSFKMPWPAIAYKERNTIAYLKGYQTPAIPGLILLHKNGLILVDKFEYKGNKASPLSNETLFSRIEQTLKQHTSR